MALLASVFLIFLFWASLWVIGHTPLKTPIWIDAPIFLIGFICLVVGVSRIIIIAVT